MKGNHCRKVRLGRANLGVIGNTYNTPSYEVALFNMNFLSHVNSMTFILDMKEKGEKDYEKNFKIINGFSLNNHISRMWRNKRR